MRKRRATLATALLVGALVASARVPGVNYPAQMREEVSILPGGRVLKPYGRQVMTGTAPFAVAVSPSGKTIVTANIGLSKSIGLDRPSITVMVPGKHDTAWTMTDFHPEARRQDAKTWQGLTAGLAVVNDNFAWVSEGDTGRVVEVNLNSGARRGIVSLNAEPYTASFTNALVYEAARNLLVVLDQANSRVAVVDPKRAVVTGSAKTGVLPVALSLSADGKRLYVANQSPPSLSIIDLSDPAAPKNLGDVPLTEDGPCGVAVQGDKVYISLSHADAIAVVDGPTAKAEESIPLRIPGLEAYRGITPLGMAWDKKSAALLVAEAGINAVAVIDTKARKVLGHIPTGWFPTAIDARGGEVYVASARGLGTGPSSAAFRVRMPGASRRSSFSFDLGPSALRRGSVSAFTLPAGEELARQTATVLEANGFTQAVAPSTGKPVPPVHHVVLIVKGNRSFDEILGDIGHAGDKQVLSEPTFARYGSDGYVSGGKQRFSLRVDVTPNHHEIASRWTFGDNFYLDSDYPAATAPWLAGTLPDYWTETALLYKEAGNQAPDKKDDRPPNLFTAQLEQHHIDFRSFGEGEDLSTKVSDQSRATRFIDTIRHDYLDAAKALPGLLVIQLPNDSTGPARPDDGFNYPASYVADNDYALGRVVEFLSRSPWWKEMTVFVMESGSDSGADHVDSHRTVLLAAGPWCKQDYVSHTNASIPALISTFHKIFGLPPLNLYDATAGDLLDMFGVVPDFTPYEAKAEDLRLFDPGKVK